MLTCMDQDLIEAEQSIEGSEGLSNGTLEKVKCNVQVNAHSLLIFNK